MRVLAVVGSWIEAERGVFLYLERGGYAGRIEGVVLCDGIKEPGRREGSVKVGVRGLCHVAMSGLLLFSTRAGELVGGSEAARGRGLGLR